MNYRVGSKREPVKRIQLWPRELLSTYPALPRLTFLREWCARTTVTTKTAGLTTATWFRVRLQSGRQGITDRLQRLELRTRTSHVGRVFIEWFSWAFSSAWTRVVGLGKAALRMSQNMARSGVSRLRSRQLVTRQASRNHPAARFEAYSAEPRARSFSSPREQGLRQELTEAHTRLVKELLAAEEELTRAATSVVRLQSLIRSQEHLIAEIARLDGNKSDSTRYPVETTDDLAGVGELSSGGELRRTPLLWKK
jgi:hypothetical protein